MRLNFASAQTHSMLLLYWGGWLLYQSIWIWINAKYNLIYLTIFWKPQNPPGSFNELVEQRDRSMKFSTQIVLLVTSIFWYSATPDFTFGDLYSHFCDENSAVLLNISLRHYLTQLKQCVKWIGLVIRNNLVFIWSQ